MKKRFLPIAALLLIAFFSCKPNPSETTAADINTNSGSEIPADFNWNPDNFGDKKIVRYTVNGFDKLSLDQKKLVYYLTQGRQERVVETLFTIKCIDIT